MINAGGLINVAAELDPEGYDHGRVMAKLAEIPATLSEIFRAADNSGRSTADVAQDMARQRIVRPQKATARAR
ncbi:MAG: hypothetical protein WEC82_00690 [Xanthobacteraceae bacterium]